MLDAAFRKLTALLNEDLAMDERRQPDDVLRTRAYARTVAEELLYRIMDCPFDAAEDIVWQYKLELQNYIQMADTKELEELFSIMLEAASFIEERIFI